MHGSIGGAFDRVVRTIRAYGSRSLAFFDDFKFSFSVSPRSLVNPDRVGENAYILLSRKSVEDQFSPSVIIRQMWSKNLIPNMRPVPRSQFTKNVKNARPFQFSEWVVWSADSSEAWGVGGKQDLSKPDRLHSRVCLFRGNAGCDEVSIYRRKNVKMCVRYLLLQSWILWSFLVNCVLKVAFRRSLHKGKLR